MADRRLFFALWPDAAQRQALLAAVDTVLPAGTGGRPVPIENLHITLAFLGAVSEGRIAALRELAQERAAVQPAPVRVRLERFEYWARPRLMCLTAASQDAAVDALAADLRRVGATVGARADPNPFRAHVTWMRAILPAALPTLRQPVSWCFERFTLIESRPANAGGSSCGSLYSTVDSWTLCGLKFPRKYA